MKKLFTPFIMSLALIRRWLRPFTDQKIIDARKKRQPYDVFFDDPNAG